ncbi:MAG: SMC-Scp complex subunit ScpB [Clostridia bacterium]|nr:SMC-Scp complex subunit ScpB [Clostridia bacterium]
MNNLTNIIEAILFASGDAVHVKYIIEKLQCSTKELNAAVDELRERYGEDAGIKLLTFNNKLQFASNPIYKEQISAVLTPIKEKELTKTILECAALVAYKQPVTKSELEEIRQVSCDYAIGVLLELEMIVPCGRKDAVGKPILYATTDVFLKRFGLNSIDELPDYNELMAQIAELNNTILTDEDDGNYLYARDEYVPEGEEKAEENTNGEKNKKVKPEDGDPEDPPNEQRFEDGYELPDFISDDDMVIKIK